MVKSAPMPTTVALKELYAPIEGPLSEVRENISNLWCEVIGLVHGPSVPRPPVQGKLLRPALSLLSAGAAGAKELDHFVNMATAMELLHLAALAHDDVVDSANIRRGMTSLNAMWNDHAAVLGGDYLVARGVQMIAEYDSCKAIINAIECIRLMAEGELANFGLGPNHGSKMASLNLAEKKTASLFAVACSTPVILVSGADAKAFWRYGTALGIAFQITDDLLDLVQDESKLGKPSCGDIMEGKLTLPILNMREGMDTQDVGRLEGMKGQNLSAEDRTWVSDMLERTGARERSEAMAREYAAEARAALDDLPPGVYRESMLGLTDFVIVRGS